MRTQNSWIISRRDNGEVIAELYNWKNVEKFDFNKIIIETPLKYLGRINKEIKEIND